MMPQLRLVPASHIGERDGMPLELRRDDIAWVAEVCEDDRAQQRVVNCFEHDFPPVVVQWLLERERRAA